MIKGEIIVNGDAGKFMAANKKGGFLLVNKGSPIPPTSMVQLETSDHHLLIEQGMDPGKFHKFK